MMTTWALHGVCNANLLCRHLQSPTGTHPSDMPSYSPVGGPSGPPLVDYAERKQTDVPVSKRTVEGELGGMDQKVCPELRPIGRGSGAPSLADKHHLARDRTTSVRLAGQARRPPCLPKQCVTGSRI